MIPVDRAHWSYSQINQFLRICPLQYAFQRIYGLKPEFITETLPFGSAIHRTAEHFLPVERRLKTSRAEAPLDTPRREST
jgi:hypothetical protein